MGNTFIIPSPNSLRARTRGRWFAILATLGVDRRYLRNKHGPCPACGGTDRFRWDDKNGDGTFYCSQCGAGSGVDLLMRVRRLSFRQAALLIEQAIFDTRSSFLGRDDLPAAPPQPSEAAIADAVNALWRRAEPLRTGDPIDLWFRHRGIRLPIPPASLRTAMRVRHRGPPLTFYPAMLAQLTDPAGTPVTIHRTWLTQTGTKAPVDPVRMFCPGKVPPASAVTGPGWARPRRRRRHRDRPRSSAAVRLSSVGLPHRRPPQDLPTSRRNPAHHRLRRPRC
ncbi:MAG: hypothetical protein J2P50_20735 [Hyphomicrobiaceae bacterium]|nr:hypothetical protein [Hyphomicrobiaceae bacterium]